MLIPGWTTLFRILGRYLIYLITGEFIHVLCNLNRGHVQGIKKRKSFLQMKRFDLKVTYPAGTTSLEVCLSNVPRVFVAFHRWR